MSAKAVAESTSNAALYAYRHVSTNQVLYSLTKALSPSALEQLPDLGANRKPAAIRRDSWKPLFAVHFGQRQSARAQAQHAYERLLEWRRLHELTWEPAAELTLSYTEEQVKTIKEDLVENRGGAKVEDAYDLIKRHKKHLKASVIMDQKANSVADLAAVLLEQQRLSGQQAHQLRALRKVQSREVQRLIGLANSPSHLESLDQQMESIRTTIAGQSWEDSPEVTRLKKQIHALETRVRVVQRRGRGQAPLSELAQFQARLRELKPKTKAELTRELEDLHKQRGMIDHATQALDKYNFTRTAQKGIYQRLLTTAAEELEAYPERWSAAQEVLAAASTAAQSAFNNFVAAKQELPEGTRDETGTLSTLWQEYEDARRAERTARSHVQRLTQRNKDLQHEDWEWVSKRRIEELKTFLRVQLYTGFPEGLRPWAEPDNLAKLQKSVPVPEEAVVEWAHTQDRWFASEWPPSVSHVTRAEETDKDTENRRRRFRNELLLWEKELVRDFKAKWAETAQSSVAEA